MRYKVTVYDFGLTPTGEALVGTIARRRSLRAARKIARRVARRGFMLFGGIYSERPWGYIAGDFPSLYRTTIITSDREDAWY